MVRFDENQFALVVFELLQVADQFAEAGGIHVVDSFEVDQDGPGLVVEHFFEIARKLSCALTQLDDTLDVQEGDVVLAVLNNVHARNLAEARFGCLTRGLERRV